MHLIKATALALLALLLAGCASTSKEVNPPLSWQHDDSSVALLRDGKTLWRFNAKEGINKPYFHPLATKDGAVLTQEKPADHVWHYGLWFSFKYLNGVNFWEEDRKTGLSKGHTKVIQIDAKTTSNHSGRFDLEIIYLIPKKGEQGEQELIEERRVIVVSPPDAAGNYSIDFQHHFLALSDVTLERTPLPGQPEGKSYGGYAGLSFRHQGEPGDWQLRENWQFIAPNDVEKLHGSPQPWMAYAGAVATGTAGTAIFDHPANVSFPTKWYVATPLTFYSPCFIFDAKHELKKGETLNLRYRVKIYSQAPEKAELEKEWKQFADHMSNKE